MGSTWASKQTQLPLRCGLAAKRGSFIFLFQCQPEQHYPWTKYMVRSEIVWCWLWLQMEVNETCQAAHISGHRFCRKLFHHSGYVFLPRENKWGNTAGSGKVTGRSNTIQQPALITASPKKTNPFFSDEQVWVQRSNGSWKNSVRRKQNPPYRLSTPILIVCSNAKLISKPLKQPSPPGKTDANKMSRAFTILSWKEPAGLFQWMIQWWHTIKVILFRRISFWPDNR